MELIVPITEQQPSSNNIYQLFAKFEKNTKNVCLCIYKLKL